MSDTDSTTPTSGGTGNGVKTLAIRLTPELHQQLSIVAKLRANTITDEIRFAIEQHLQTLQADPDLTAMASSALEEIERDADARRSAIATLFGDAPADSTTSRPRSRKSPTSGNKEG